MLESLENLPAIGRNDYGRSYKPAFGFGGSIKRLWGLFAPFKVAGMRPHNPLDLYVLGVLQRLHDVKPDHMALEYRPIFVAMAFTLEQFINNDFNIELLPNAVEAARQLFAFIKTFATMSDADDFMLDRGVVEEVLKKGLLAARGESQ